MSAERKRIDIHEAVDRLDVAVGAVVRRHGESEQVRELLHAVAALELFLRARADEASR